MNPETRKLIQVLPGDAAKTKEMFELFWGDSARERGDRRSYIEEHGHK
jgi:DNA gyrase subunit B